MIDSDFIAPLTNSVCSGVTVTTHVYVPLSMEELGGENTNWAIDNVLLTLVCGRTVTRPLTPENTAPSLVHVLFTSTSLSVTPPSKLILQFRVTVSPTGETLSRDVKSNLSAGGGTGWMRNRANYKTKLDSVTHMYRSRVLAATMRQQ